MCLDENGSCYYRFMSATVVSVVSDLTYDKNIYNLVKGS